MPAEHQQRPDRQLKILEMCTQFGVGGITRHVLDLRDWLRAHGHDVTLAGTADAWADPEKEAQFVSLATRYVAGDGGNIAQRLRHLAGSAATLRRWLKQNPIDVIHAHESAPALVANLARRGLNIPLAVTYHGSEPERIAQFGKIARNADLVITPSHRSAEDLATTGGVPRARLKVIGLGVKPAPVHPATEVASLRQNLLGDGDQLVVIIARQVYQKGIDILIDCIATLKQTHPQIRFVLVGDGPLEKDMKALAAEKNVLSHMHFAGRSATPHLFLQAADLFLLTSRWEALPFTIVEAFQTGTPTVATACSGVVELIDDAVGTVVPVGDVSAICAAVTSELADETALATKARAALERSREDRFQPDWVHRQFEKTYLDLAG